VVEVLAFQQGTKKRHEKSARRYSMFHWIRYGLTLRGAGETYDSRPVRARDAPLARASFLRRLTRRAQNRHASTRHPGHSSWFVGLSNQLPRPDDELPRVFV
jgi:hypothetical protein